jgi:uncharacterized membrane protein
VTASATAGRDTADWLPVRAVSGGYLQGIDENVIVKLAAQHDFVVELRRRIGDFVIENDELARVSRVSVTRELGDRVRSAFTVGAERTPYQDVERGIIELTDIGVRALSPGLNDPTTALVCVDRLMQIVARLATRHFPNRERADEQGNLRVIARRPSYPELVELAYSGLRHYSRTHPVVTIELARSLVRLLAIVPDQRRAPLRDELRHLLAAAHTEWRHAEDLARLDAVAAHQVSGLA